MDQYLLQFLDSLATHKGYSENTIAAYRNDLSQFIQYLQQQRGPNPDLAGIHSDLVQAYVANLQEGPEQYALSTVARKIAAVKSFFHFLHEQRLIATDPAAHLSSPKVKKNVPKTLTYEEMQRLLEAPRRAGGPKAVRDSALLELLCATGLRVTEVVNLRLGDVDWGERMVICRGKGDRQRRIPMGAAYEPLQEYVQRARPALQHDGGLDILFLNHRGRKLTRQGVWLILKEAAEAAGVGKDVTPHTLRHSFASGLVGQGEDLKRVQELLGHANISTTQVYKQTTAEPEADAPSSAAS